MLPIGGSFVYSSALGYRVYQVCRSVEPGLSPFEVKDMIKRAEVDLEEAEVDYRYDVSREYPKDEKTIEYTVFIDSAFSPFYCAIQHNGKRVIWSKLHGV